MWLLDPHNQVKSTPSYDHVIDMMGTLDAVHNFLGTFRVPDEHCFDESENGHGSTEESKR